MNQPKTLLSMCMIARNEERWLPRDMGSVRPWVEDLVLVDTGSSVRTVEIARQFGSRVFVHPWENYFALHRNQALAQGR